MLFYSDINGDNGAISIFYILYTYNGIIYFNKKLVQCNIFVNFRQKFSKIKYSEVLQL